MKKIIPYVFVVLMLFPGANKSIAQIDSFDVLVEFFEGCVQEDGGLGVGKQFEYCGCVTGAVSEGMTLKELFSLGLDAASAGDNEQELAKIVLANDKFKDYVVSCVAKLYE